MGVALLTTVVHFPRWLGFRHADAWMPVVSLDGATHHRLWMNWPASAAPSLGDRVRSLVMEHDERCLGFRAEAQNPILFLVSKDEFLAGLDGLSCLSPVQWGFWLSLTESAMNVLNRSSLDAWLTPSTFIHTIMS